MITAVGVVGENWANINDPVERRRAQNRIAQRGYRRRQRKEKDSAQAQENSTDGAVKPPSGPLPSPPQQERPKPPRNASHRPPTPIQLPQGYSHPLLVQQQPLPPLTANLHLYTTAMDSLGFDGTPWTPALEEDGQRPFFGLETPFLDPVYVGSPAVAPHALPSPDSDPLSASSASASASASAGAGAGAGAGAEGVAPPLLQLQTPHVTPEAGSAAAPHGQTALHRAALHGHESVLAVLLQAGADPAVPDSAGLTPLHLAARQGHARVVQLLLGHGGGAGHAGGGGSGSGGGSGGEQIGQVTRTGETALHLAVQSQHLPVVHVLLEHPGCAVNAQDWWGCTPLHLACEANHQELVEILVQAGAQLELRDFDGQTPLHSACMGGR